MPGTYPRSTNPYFPFERLEWVEEQLNLFHDLTYSASYRSWALTTVFTTFSEAATVAGVLNSQLGPNQNGRYVVVPANATLVWCRAKTIGNFRYSTSDVLAWSGPVASQGYIIVWEPDNEVVLTTSEYLGYFNKTPYLNTAKQILYPSNLHYEFSYPAGGPGEHTSHLSLPPLEYKPVKDLPILDRCIGCGELFSFCCCSDE
jgi:hypothetical protein